MDIFIDSADIKQIREAFSWGIVDGVTTNPSLIKIAAQSQGGGDKASMTAYIKDILLAVEQRPVSLEVIGPDEESMIRQGRILYETFNPVAGNVVVKVPVNPSMEPGDGLDYDGLRVISKLHEEGIPLNVTLVFSPEQALLAAKAGADYVSPFAGRVDDDLRTRLGGAFDKTAYFPAEGHIDESKARNGSATIDSMSQDNLVHDNGVVSGVDLVSQIVTVFSVHGIGTKVLAASIRNSRQARECAEAGADVSTLPFNVIQEMIQHKKTREGMRAFTNDIVPEYAALFE